MKRTPRVTRGQRRAQNSAIARQYLLPDLGAIEDYRQGIAGLLERWESEDIDEEEAQHEAERRVYLLFPLLFHRLASHNEAAAEEALGPHSGAQLQLMGVYLAALGTSVVLLRDLARDFKSGEVSKDMATWRLTLIAEDQGHKTNLEINRARMRAAGVTQFYWLTRRDDLVRPTHAIKDGNIYAYDDPPADTGLPGQPVNCRCVDVGIIPNR